MNTNLLKAIAILNGNNIVAPDRKAETATPIPFVQVTTARTRTTPKIVALRPAFGVSWTMQQALTKLANNVEMVKTRRGRRMPEYRFVIKGK